MFSLHKFFLGFLIFLLFAENPAFAFFNDLKNGELTPEVIEFLREQEIGEASENFYPRRPITLVEFLAMGFSAAGVFDLPRNVASRFSDVAGEDWFAPFVVKAEQFGFLEDFRGMKVPEILLSGDHERIAEWRKEQSLERTKKWRPDLLEKGLFSGED